MATAARTAEAKPERRELWPNAGGQAEFCASADPVAAMVSPWGDGKSWGLCHKGHCLAIEYAPCTIVLARKERVDAVKNLLPVFREDIVGMRNFDRRYSSSDFTYYYDNGSRAIIGGTRQHDSWSGGRLTYLGIDEPIAPLGSGPGSHVTENEVLTFQGRMREMGSGIHQIALATNPGPPGHWLLRWQQEGKIRLINVEPGTNDWRHPPGYLARKQSLTGAHYQRYVLGQWVGAEGLVYAPPWEHSTHAVVVPKPAKGVPIVCAIDWGFSRGHEFSMGFYYVNGARQRCRFDELYGEGRTVQEWAALAAMKCEHNPVLRVWTDVNPELQETFARAFRLPGADKPLCAREKVMDAEKDIHYGVNQLREAMKIRADGLPGFVQDVYNCPVGIQQVETLPWDETRDKPLKKEDHAPDEMRYYVASEEFHGYKVDAQPARTYELAGAAVGPTRLATPGYLSGPIVDRHGFLPLRTRRPRRS